MHITYIAGPDCHSYIARPHMLISHALTSGKCEYERTVRGGRFNMRRVVNGPIRGAWVVGASVTPINFYQPDLK